MGRVQTTQDFRTRTMDGGIQFLDIILFALIAAFLILRLRSVLGRRDGHESPSRDPFRAPSRREAGDDKVIRLPDVGDGPADTRAEPGRVAADADSPLETGLAQIRAADPSFDPQEFLSGARIAFEMVLTSFAAGDVSSLKPLLSPEVFGNFQQSIREREEAGETMQNTLVGFASVDLLEAYLAGRTAHVTLKFVSEQIIVTRNENGDLLEGDADEVTTVTDIWTFARDTRTRDPNWTLVATGALE